MLSRRSFCLSTVAFAAAGAPYALAQSSLPRHSSRVERPGEREPNSAIRATRIAWLDRHTSDLSSVDLEDDDFDDLAAFEEAIGDARIVMLGEPTSGDGTALQAKSRLVRFLHEEMDFNVLAFESGLYDMRKVWYRIRAGASARKAARRGLSPAWSQSEEMKSLIDYIGERARHRRPLELAGFDCRFSASASRDRMADDLVEFLADQDINPESIPDWAGFLRAIKMIADGSNLRDWKPSAEEEQLVGATIDSLIDRIAGPEEPEACFWEQVLTSTKALTRLRRQWEPQNPSSADADLLNATMADNLIWLAREACPESKIIVWGETSRTLRNPQMIDPAIGMTTMGHHAWQELGDAIYTVAVTSYAGERTVAGETQELDRPLPDSLEGLWGETEDEIAFLDLRRLPEGGEWLQEPLTSRVGGREPMRADWTATVDGVLFVRNMEPTTIEE